VTSGALLRGNPEGYTSEMSATATPHVHAHAPGHACDGHHGHAPIGKLRVVLVITALFFVAEVVGGFLSNSLALLADAGHMLADVGALALSLFCAWVARQPAGAQRTFGYLRAEILAAFINGSVLLVISVAIAVEAVQRFVRPEAVATGPMLLVAGLGLGVNAVAAWLLHADAAHSLNVRGAYLHVLGDLLGSVATVVAALVIRWTGWAAADPVASLLTMLLIVRGAWALVRESVDVLLESAPKHVDPVVVRQRLEALPGVLGVHDLHVWTVAGGMISCTAHAVVSEADRYADVLRAAQDALAREFGIRHVTLQLEPPGLALHESGLHA
jgi:cobalt-zinc-cadmium efflux system protein